MCYMTYDFTGDFFFDDDDLGESYDDLDFWANMVPEFEPAYEFEDLFLFLGFETDTFDEKILAPSTLAAKFNEL